MRRAIELAVAVIAAAHDDTNGAVGVHRNERRLARPRAASFPFEGRLDGLLGQLLERHVDGGARGEDELALAFHEPLHFLEGPIQEVVRDVDLLTVDDLRRIEPGAMHLPFGHEPGLDEVGENLVRARADSAGFECGANFVGALNRPASTAASARLMSRTDLPK